MTWLFPSAVATMMGTLLLVLLYFYLYLQDHNRYMLIWSASWSVYLIRFIFMLAIIAGNDSPVLLIGNQFSSLISGVLLLWGTYLYINKKMPRFWIAVTFVSMLWIVGSISLEFNFMSMSMPTFFLLSGVNIYTGIIFIQAKKEARNERIITGVSFILWGIHKANYPFLRPVIWFAPWGYIIGAFLEFLVAIGVVLLHFQRSKSQLTASNEKMKLAAESAHFGIWNLDVKENRLEWDDWMFHLYGINRNDFGGVYEAWQEGVHPDDLDRSGKEVEQALKGEKEFNTEFRIVRPDGQVRYIKAHAIVSRDSNGEPTKMIGINYDITDKIEAEKALRESEEKFRLVFHTSPDSININRLEDGMYLEINQGFTQIMGYRREDVIGKTSIELNIWKNPADRKRLIDGLRETGYVANLEAEFVGNNGLVRDGLMSARVLTINNEKVIISITRDITDRKRVEMALKASEEQHRSIIETAMDGFWLTDVTGNLLEVNLTYCQMSGYTQEELLGMTISDLEAIESESEVMDHMATLITKQQDRFESKHRRKDGTVFEVEVSLQYKMSDEGRCICFIRDITDQKKFMEKLQQAQKMESIGNLAGGIAHDFNNILFPIVGIAEMLVEDLPSGSPEQENALEILRAGKRGSSLVQQILAFSRQHEHRLSPTRLQFVMKEVLKLTRASIPTNIEITRSLQPDCGLIFADSTQLHQIGMNLITNAYHAVQDQGGKINIEVREIEFGDDSNDPRLPPGKYATLTVADNGIGIPQEHLDKIFDPYFTTKEKGKGTGLGLSVVYGIVREHNGEIKVHSEPGKGTSVRIYIPAMSSSAANDESMPANPLPTGSEHILLVDDEVAIANLEMQILERLGYTVSKRTNSTDALEAFRNNPDRFDLVITDISMPQMTGDRLANEIMKIRPDMPIIICTGFSERISQEQALSMGVKGFLMKPLVKADIANEVRRVLDEA